MTDGEYKTWLQDTNAIRCVLVEAQCLISGTLTTVYLSTFGYVTQSGDTPSNTAYLPLISTGIQYTEQIQLNIATDVTEASNTSYQSSSGMTGGDIELFNEDRFFDPWLNPAIYVWTNRPIKAFIGDPRWNGIGSSYTRADFRMIFDGVITDIASQSRDRVNLVISDKTEILDCNVNAALLGGTTSNAQNAIPLCFGECFNITPLLIDPTTLSYQVHDGPIEEIIEIRDNGVPIYNSTLTGGATVTLSTGIFALTAQPAGTITCSVQGDKYSGTYRNTIASLIEQLVVRYGIPGASLTSADLDSAQLAAFDTAHPQPVGIYLSGGENLLDTCETLAASVGAQMIMARTGLLQIIQITFPVPGTAWVVNEQSVREHTLEETDRSPAVASMMLGYCQNWTVQQNLTTAIPVRDLDFFATDWMTVTETDAPTATNYLLPVYPIQQNTQLLRLTDASAEATRQLNVFKIPRTTYQFDGTVDLMQLVLGDPITITHPDYNMEAGVTGMIVMLAPDWMSGKVTVGFMV